MPSGEVRFHRSDKSSRFRANECEARLTDSRNRRWQQIASPRFASSLPCEEAAMKFRDDCEVLGVARCVDAAALNKALRKRAFEWHPDRHRGAHRARAAARFQQVMEVHEVLSAPPKRAQYDRFGKA